METQLDSTNVAPGSEVTHSSNRVDEHCRVAPVFADWCLRRETLRIWPYHLLLMPLIFAGYSCWLNLGLMPSRVQGPQMLESLFWMAAAFIVIGGARHASNSVCWETCRELRDLVRLTGVDPQTLLWCQTLSRWWTILLSIVLLVPLAMYARTLGGVTGDRWIAGTFGIAMLAILTAGFAMIASVSPGHSNNLETTATTGTIILMVLYNVAFWVVGAVIRVVEWLASGANALPSGSILSNFAAGISALPPITTLYRAIAAPSLFSPLEFSYWLHLVVAGICLRLAAIVMTNRFRVTTRGDEDTSLAAVTSPSSTLRAPSRPRCGDQPFFWKDAYVIGGGRRSQRRWNVLSVFAMLCVMTSVYYRTEFGVGLIAIGLAPCLIAVRFDSLLAAEFREQTWAGLMALPIDPRVPVLAKIYAAAWERRTMLLPLCVAALFSACTDTRVTLMTASVSLIAGVIMIEVSIINHLNAKAWWTGLVIGGMVVSLIFFNLVIWAITSNSQLNFVISISSTVMTAWVLYVYIVSRLQKWTDS